MNNVCLVGRTTKDIEIKKTNTGKSVCQFTLAVDSGKKDDNGNRMAYFIECEAWEKTAELLGSYVNKGNQLAVNGELFVDIYDDKDYPNRKVYRAKVRVRSVTLLEKKSETAKESATQSYSIDSDELPF